MGKVFKSAKKIVKKMGFKMVQKVPPRSFCGGGEIHKRFIKRK